MSNLFQTHTFLTLKCQICFSLFSYFSPSYVALYSFVILSSKLMTRSPFIIVRIKTHIIT